MISIHLFGLLISSLILDFTSGSSDLVWYSWKQRHGKQYVDSVEEQRRRAIWQQEVDEVAEHNSRYDADLETYRKGLNQFSDMTWDELKAIYLSSLEMPKESMTGNQKEIEKASDLPDSIDWRDKGYVTVVKNQGGCGSCWAFSAVGTLEGQLANKTKQNATSLSAQQLVDCDTGSHGCKGGWPAQALAYTQKEGVESWEDYPYIGRQGKCKYNASNVVFKNSGFWTNFYAGEEAMKSMLATHGPLSIAIDVTRSFYSYQSGVFTTSECNPKVVNHAVLAVGYGVEKGKDFWLVKNSWSARWGDHGYIKMARNQGNMCNVATYPVVAVI